MLELSLGKYSSISTTDQMIALMLDMDCTRVVLPCKKIGVFLLLSFELFL